MNWDIDRFPSLVQALIWMVAITTILIVLFIGGYLLTTFVYSLYGDGWAFGACMTYVLFVVGTGLIWAGLEGEL